MNIKDIIPARTIIEVGAAALASPVTPLLEQLTQTTTKGDRDDASEAFVISLRTLRTKQNGVTETRQLVALSDWQLRLTCSYKGKDGVVRPDYNGKSPMYKKLRDDALRAAGLDVTSKTTPFEAQGIAAARDSYLSITRYEVRKIADAVLSAADLLAAGFRYTAQLPSDQKLAKPLAAQKPVPVADRIAGIQGSMADLLSRKGDVRRDLTLQERMDASKRIAEQCTALIRLLALTPAEEAVVNAQRTAAAKVATASKEVATS